MYIIIVIITRGDADDGDGPARLDRPEAEDASGG